jgi:tripartite ATP-independent transporter DctM subunit
MSSEQLILILMFAGVFVGIFTGHYIAFVMGGLAVIFGYIGWGPACFGMFINRIYASMDDYVLVAIPLFLFMAQFLERSGVTDDLFEALRYLMGPIPGGIALAVVVVSAIFAACTGIVGASVVTMGLLAMPVLLKYKYSKELSSGVVAAGGSLGILIPPSIMLVVMASQTGVSVGKLYAGALMPGIILSTCYLLYVGIKCLMDPASGPPMTKEERQSVSTAKVLLMCAKSLVPPMILILGVLGSIFTGFATATEAAAIGAFFAGVLVVAYGKFTWKCLYEAATRTLKATGMVFAILIAASCFTGVFLGLGGVDIVTKFIISLGLGKWGIFVMMMIVLLVLGCLLDWVAIVLICFPVFLPLADQFGFDKLWFLVVMAVNLQASFLTPPFGYALFYLGGICPPEVKMIDIYKGVVPFVIIICIVVAIITIWPESVLWLPSQIVN